MVITRKPQTAPAVAIEFTLPSGRALQCPAIDPKTGEFYVSQASGLIRPETIVISRNSATGLKRKLLSTMRLEKAGHGSMITVLHRNGVLGIVTNAWGRMSWVPYVAGTTIKKGDKRVQSIWSGGYAYIDQEANTVCLSGGGKFRLYPLVGDKLGQQIGKTTTGVTSTGPGQGFCTMKSGPDFLLFTMWDYGRIKSRPTVAVGSFTTGGPLYKMSARVLPKEYTRQEPEAGFTLGGVLYVGMSVYRKRKKSGVALKFGLPAVTRFVRAHDDPIWDSADAVHYLHSRDATGGFGNFKRAPGVQIGGQIVEKWGDWFVQVSANEFYRLSYLTATNPKVTS